MDSVSFKEYEMSNITIAPAIGISASALDAERLRMKVVANNVANAQSHSLDGTPYRRKEVIFKEKLSHLMADSGVEAGLQGVEVEDILESQLPFKVMYRPGNPYADEDGYVKMPNVNTVEEMVDMMSASRSYQANLSAVKMSKTMANEALEMLKS